MPASTVYPALLFLAMTSAPAAAQVCSFASGPDLIVGDLQEIANYPSTGSGTLEALSIGTTACNLGDANVLWIAANTNHPVASGNLYRLRNNGGWSSMEQIGMSWLKHGFFALNQTACCTNCTSGGGNELGSGCSDAYTAARNGSQGNLGPRWQVNANTGAFTYPPANPGFSGSTARRLQVAIADLEPTASTTTRYFGEGHYVTADDALAGNQNNNASYRELTVSGAGSNWTFGLTGSTVRERPAIGAWRDVNPLVTETEIQLPGEGLVILAHEVTELGGGTWHYEYALYNMNSDDGIGSFAVPIPAGVTVANVGFHDVTYRDGDGIGSANQDGTDWAATMQAGSLDWSTFQTFGQDPNGNALRWGTTYNFRFDADRPPAMTTIALTRFKTGASVLAPAAGPAAGVFVFGMEHTAVNQAQLSQGGGGELLVTNLGSSGSDGVSVALGSAEGFHGHLNLPPEPSIPVGAVFNYRCIAMVPGVGDQVVMEQQTQRLPGGFEITPDFSGSGSPTYTMTLLLNGVVVFEQAGRSGAAGTVPSLGATPEICEHPTATSRNTSQQLASPQPWDVGGGPLIMADLLLAGADTPTALAPDSTFRIELLGGDIASFGIPAEWLLMFTDPSITQAHQALGDAQFDADADRLTVANIGSSGLDGVRVDFVELSAGLGQAPVRGVDIELVALSLQSNEDFTVSAIGVFSGTPDSQIGQASLRNNGGQLELHADFATIGASTVRVEVLLAGQLVGTVDVLGGGVVGTLSPSAVLDGCGKLPPFPSPPCFFMTMESPVTLTPAGGGPQMIGDEVRLLAANASGTIERLSYVDLTYTSTTPMSGAFSILGETPLLDPPLFPAFCDDSDGSLALCPCANSGSPDTGCDIQQGTGGVGLAVVAQETSPQNRVTLSGTGFPAASTPTSIVIRAAGLDMVAPVVFGDGLRCIGTPLVRLAATLALGGTATHTHGHSTMAGTGDFYYQLWFRNTPAMYCTPDAFNLSNGRTLTW